MTYYTCGNTSFVAQKGKISLSLAIIFGLLLMSVAYLSQINNIVAKNFELRAAQALLKAKQDKNQQLSVGLMQVKSLSSLESAAKSLNLVNIEKIDYLKVPSGIFVLSQRQ
jgi:hypothetical protein